MPPPLGRQNAAPGEQRPPPHLPPPLPLRPKSGRRQTEETAAPHPPRRGRCTGGEGAPRPRQAPARPARCRPTADRRRPGRRKRSGPFRGRPGEDGGANQGGGVPPPSPPPPRRTDLLTADRTAPDARGRPATPTARVYPGGARRRQRMAGRRPMGRGSRGAPPPPPPRSPPPAWGPQERTFAPPEPRGRPPSPRRDHDAGGGGGDAAGPAHRAPERPQPPAPAGVAADRRAHTSAPEQSADQASGRRTAAHQNCMEAAPPMTLP